MASPLLRQRRDRLRAGRASRLLPSSRVSDSIVRTLGAVARLRRVPGAAVRRLTLALDARGHVLDGHDQADDPAVLAQRSDRDVLLHPIESRRRCRGRTAEQVVVQGRSQHLDRAPRQHVLQDGQRDRAPRSREARPRAAGSAPAAGSMPVASAIQSIPRTDHEVLVGGEDAEWKPVSGHKHSHRGIARRSVRTATRRGQVRVDHSAGSRAPAVATASVRGPIDEGDKACARRSRSSVPPRVCLTPLAFRSVICADFGHRRQQRRRGDRVLDVGPGNQLDLLGRALWAAPVISRMVLV